MTGMTPIGMNNYAGGTWRAEAYVPSKAKNSRAGRSLQKSDSKKTAGCFMALREDSPSMKAAGDLVTGDMEISERFRVMPNPCLKLPQTSKSNRWIPRWNR